MNILLKDAAAEMAAARYAENAGQINNMRNSIRLNRRGGIRLTDIPQDPVQLKKRAARENAPDAKTALERINGVANFQDVCIVKKIMRMSDAVCRITIPVDMGGTEFGTGFLVAPNIIITNHHVFPTTGDAAMARAEFHYELDENGVPGKSASFGLRPDLFFITSDLVKQPGDPFSGLDFTLVAVDEISAEGKNISELAHIRLDGGPGKILEGENCIVIQHPSGDYKKVVLKDIRMITYTDDFLVYESDTKPGSSGSMVIGLGTGEVVGLHHSGVPRKDANGNWLRKDGSIVSDNDTDDVIDWIGNEGIRVSSIVKAVTAMPLNASMEALRQQLLGKASSKENITINTNTQPMPATIISNTPAGASLQRFEVIISPQELMQKDWMERKYEVVPGLKTVERVFPLSADEELKRHYYITVESDKTEWDTAAAIEKLPQVESCIPDVPVLTHTAPGVAEPGASESAIFGRDTTDEQNWSEFENKWKDGKWFKAAQATNIPNYIRQWNWEAVKANAGIAGGLAANLEKLKLVQLDTGYSMHTKNTGGYDFTNDHDCIDDDDDAKGSTDKDETNSVAPQIGHGTRTASLVIGNKLAADPKKCDGNKGLLTGANGPFIKLWPYRVSESVILLGSVKNMIKGARMAVDAKADVIFMCMGIYPRPIISAAARYAYDNGVIWVCAAGNYVKVVVAPALCPGTIAVAAINPANDPWDQSSYGKEVDIAAPGEKVYVPVVDTMGRESMRYGDGTSYATPHVAAAAMMWKAHHGAALNQYRKPWQIVEAFRHCLKESSDKNVPWIQNGTDKYYGAGLLDIPALLAQPLPNGDDLKYAYEGISTRPGWDLGIIEAAGTIWNAISRNLWGREAAFAQPLTERGMQGMAALTGMVRGKVTEETGSFK